MQKVYFTEGVARELPEVGYSEVCCHMRIAGRTDMAAKVLAGSRMVELRDGDGRTCPPITVGEAGLYRDNDGRVYGYKPKRRR